jgi:hypothetical protein
MEPQEKCPICGQKMIIGSRMEEFIFRDEPYRVMWTAWRCLCHDAEYSTSVTDQRILEVIAEEYRKRHHLPSDYPVPISEVGKIAPK